MFLTVQDVDNPDGAFWSDDYWKTYLDIMARSRYNFLDIHGLCDAVTISFPNGFSYFLSLPDFPEVGVGPNAQPRIWRARHNSDGDRRASGRLHEL